MRLSSVLISAITLGSTAFAQNISVGIIVGGSTTDGFKALDIPNGTHFFSTSKDYLIGPTLEWSFSSRWSIEADALFRELHLGVGVSDRDPVVTWEFPILAKYRFTASRFRPFAEGGAAFRTAGNLNGTNPSHYGVTAGAGIETNWGTLTFAPVVHYTRWAGDSGNGPSYQAKSNSNQLELAVAVTTAAVPNVHPLGARISVGVLAGLALTDDVRATSFAFTSGIQSYSQTTSPRKGIIVGPMLELRLPANFSFEADALYAPLRLTTVSASTGLRPFTDSISIGNWDIPLLAKRRFPMPVASPFLEAGPAFRIGTGELSHYGLTAGAGLDLRFHALRIAPTFRYLHWAAESTGSSNIRNQVEFLTAVSF